MMENQENLVVLEFDLPEFNRDDISVKVGDDKVEIHAMKKKESKVDEEDFEWFEKYSRTFDYSSSLPLVVGSEANIEFEKGKLKIAIPKK